MAATNVQAFSGDVEVAGNLDVSGDLGSSLINLIYPVGSVYISVNSTNPESIWAGTTWTAFGAGRTLVGIDSGDGDFNSAEETGGAKTHTLTTAELASHTHSYYDRWYSLHIYNLWSSAAPQNCGGPDVFQQQGRNTGTAGR
jgi:hypothetical protein